MKAIFSASLVALLGNAVLPALAEMTGSYPNQPTAAPDAGLGIGNIVDNGCYSTSGDFFEAGYYLYQTEGWCNAWCARNHYKMSALSNGSDCFCGSKLPPDSAKVDSSLCNTPCNGYGAVDCGGNGAFHFYQFSFLGSETATPIPFYDMAKETDAPSASSVINGPSTIYITASGSVVAQTVYATSAASGSGSNKAAIAAGVVVGVVALLAIAGGAVFFIRQKKRREFEEERRRHEAISNFVGKGEKSPSSSASMTDSRLEPSVMFQRRMSDGSIADNQDYSRRILKVTNPDFRQSNLPQ